MHSPGGCQSPEQLQGIGTAQRQHPAGFLIWYPGVCGFGVWAAGCLEMYCQRAWLWVLYGSMLLKAALGKAGASERWDGAARGLAWRRAHSLHSAEEETQFPRGKDCPGDQDGACLMCLFTAMGLWWKAGGALTPSGRADTG